MSQWKFIFGPQCHTLFALGPMYLTQAFKLASHYENTTKVLIHYHTSLLLTTLCKKAYENIVEKEENACNQHYLQFQQCFLANEGKFHV